MNWRPTFEEPELLPPHVREWIRVNATYLKAGAAKDMRPLCMYIMDGEPCRYPARPGKESCGRRHG